MELRTFNIKNIISYDKYTGDTRFVDDFGNTLHAYMTEPKTGITIRAACDEDEIKAWGKESGSIPDLKLLLKACGIDPLYAYRIRDDMLSAGSERSCLEGFLSHPYTALMYCYGTKFADADKCSAYFPDKSDRAQAEILSFVQDTCMKKSDLAKKLDVSGKQMDDALIHLSRKRQIVMSDDDIYDISQFVSEDTLAQEIAKRAGRKKENVYDISSIFNDIERTYGNTYTSTEREIIARAVSEKIFCIAGPERSDRDNVADGLMKCHAMLGRRVASIDAKTDSDVVIINDCTFIDLTTIADLLTKIPEKTQIVFVGDPNIESWFGEILGLVSNIRFDSVPETYEKCFLNRRVPDFKESACSAEDVCRAYKKGFQVLTPVKSGALGTENLNRMIQAKLTEGNPYLALPHIKFARGDKVVQLYNTKDVPRRTLGVVKKIDLANERLYVDFDGRSVMYERHELNMLDLAYAITPEYALKNSFIVPIPKGYGKWFDQASLYMSSIGDKCVILGSKKEVEKALRTRAPKKVSNLASKIKAYSTTLEEKIAEGIAKKEDFLYVRGLKLSDAVEYACSVFKGRRQGKTIFVFSDEVIEGDEQNVYGYAVGATDSEVQKDIAHLGVSLIEPVKNAIYSCYSIGTTRKYASTYYA